MVYTYVLYRHIVASCHVPRGGGESYHICRAVYVPGGVGGGGVEHVS